MINVSCKLLKIHFIYDKVNAESWIGWYTQDIQKHIEFECSLFTMG